jgi:hypothetical protein
MTEDPVGGAPLERSAALVRLARSDADRFMTLLAGRLEALLPGLVRTRRAGSPLRRRRPPARIEIALGDARLALTRSATGITGEHGVVVHGIVVRTDTLSLDEWLGRLAAALEHHGESAAAGEAAVARLLELD